MRNEGLRHGKADADQIADDALAVYFIDLDKGLEHGLLGLRQGHVGRGGQDSPQVATVNRAPLIHQDFLRLGYQRDTHAPGVGADCVTCVVGHGSRGGQPASGQASARVCTGDGRIDDRVVELGVGLGSKHAGSRVDDAVCELLHLQRQIAFGERKRNGQRAIDENGDGIFLDCAVGGNPCEVVVGGQDVDRLAESVRIADLIGWIRELVGVGPVGLIGED